ncbi:hypothetical protein [Cryobacterium adonitolivorans]|nr:hypothetical protein [Cryobacterium adonitolivorans]
MSDSYVDVYVHSQPTLVGSFLVIDSALQIPPDRRTDQLPHSRHTPW